jgi:membrane associated rhomboid family serine protease
VQRALPLLRSTTLYLLVFLSKTESVRVAKAAVCPISSPRGFQENQEIRLLTTIVVDEGTMKVRLEALLLLGAISLSEACDVISRKLVTTAAKAPVQRHLVGFDLVDLRGGDSSSPRQGVTRRQRQNETKLFFTVNAFVYLGLLIAMSQTGVCEFVELVNVGVFAMWWISFAEKPVKGLVRHIFGQKETNAYQCNDFVVSDDDTALILEVERGETLEWPEKLICVGVTNGWTDGQMEQQRNMLDQAVTEEKARYLLKRRTKTIRLKFVSEKSIISSVLKKSDSPAQDFMKKHFLQPEQWPQFRKQPFSMFGAVFSHVDVAHLLANLSTFRVFALYAERRLGNLKFALLYLSCILSSTAFACWQSDAKKAQHGLGASGAITGVLSWCCISMNVVDGTPLRIQGKEVNSLIVLLLYVLQDALGLFRINGNGVNSAVVALLLGTVEAQLGLGTVGDKKEKMKLAEANVGYAAHLGGYLGGMIFFALNLACEMVPVYLAESRRRSRYRRR